MPAHARNADCRRRYRRDRSSNPYRRTTDRPLVAHECRCVAPREAARKRCAVRACPADRRPSKPDRCSRTLRATHRRNGKAFRPSSMREPSRAHRRKLLVPAHGPAPASSQAWSAAAVMAEMHTPRPAARRSLRGFACRHGESARSRRTERGLDRVIRSTVAVCGVSRLSIVQPQVPMAPHTVQRSQPSTRMSAAAPHASQRRLERMTMGSAVGAAALASGSRTSPISSTG